jgi:DNA-directed RNA polymerase specialized sigma24 family protein
VKRFDPHRCGGGCNNGILHTIKLTGTNSPAIKYFFGENNRTCILLATFAYFPPVKEDKYQHISDQELLERFYRDHDNEWLGILLQRYTLLLLGVSMKYLKHEEEAKDSVQQIFLKVIQELPKYRVEFFKSWLYMVAKNHCLMKIREKQGKLTAEWNERVSHTLPAEETHPGTDGKLAEGTESRAAAMCNFVLPGKEKLPGDQ